MYVDDGELGAQGINGLSLCEHNQVPLRHGSKEEARNNMDFLTAGEIASPDLASLRRCVCGEAGGFIDYLLVLDVCMASPLPSGPAYLVVFQVNACLLVAAWKLVGELYDKGSRCCQAGPESLTRM